MFLSYPIGFASTSEGSAEGLASGTSLVGGILSTSVFPVSSVSPFALFSLAGVLPESPLEVTIVPAGPVLRSSSPEQQAMMSK